MKRETEKCGGGSRDEGKQNSGEFLRNPDCGLRSSSRLRLLSAVAVALYLYPMSVRPMEMTPIAKTQDSCPSPGLHIPPEIPYKRAGGVPQWQKRYGAENLNEGRGRSSFGQEIIGDGRSVCMVLYLRHQDHSRDVLDAVNVTHIYPKARHFPKNYKPIKYGVERSYCYAVDSKGEFDRDSKDQIVGFSLPIKGKEDCAHFSRWILSAWRIDFKAQRYVSLDVTNLICDRPEAGDSCY